MPTRILLVEDSPVDRELTRLALHRVTEPHGPIELECAGDWREAWPRLVGEHFDLVLLDFYLPGTTGLHVLEELKHHRHPPVVMITGQDDLATAVETLRAGAYDYVVKSRDMATNLRLTVERVLARAALEREVAESRVKLASYAAALEEQVAARTALVQTQAAEIERLCLTTERAARMNAEIVAKVARELREPLDAIRGYAESLGEKLSAVAGGAAPRILERICEQTERLRTLVASAQALAKLRSTSEVASFSRFTLDALAEELRADARALNLDEHLHLECRVTGTGGTVESDRERIRTIAYHLLSNAFQLTRSGRVDLEVKRTPASGIQLVVRDADGGAASETRATAAERPHPRDGSTTRPHDGAGIGLGIAKRFTSLLHGRLSLESVPGGGTTITVEIPSRKARPAGEPALDPARLAAASKRPPRGRAR